MVQRLMLMAAPQLDPQQLRDMNYEERRGALYLLVAAELPAGLDTAAGSSISSSASPSVRADAAHGADSCINRVGAECESAGEVEDAGPEAPSPSASPSPSPVIWQRLRGLGDVSVWSYIVSYL